MSQCFIHNRTWITYIFKLKHFKIVCTKLAHFKFEACYRSQNSWDRGMFTMV